MSVFGVKRTCRDVRFSPNSGHQRLSFGCPLCANSGHELWTKCPGLTTERAMTSRRWPKLPSRPPTPFATVEQCACKQRMLNAAICDGAARGHVPRPKMGRGLSFDSIADDELGDLICCQVH